MGSISSYKCVVFINVNVSHRPFFPGRDENHMTEPDDNLIDECCLLPSQLLVPSMDWLPVNDGIIGKLQSKQPLKLQFGKPVSVPSHFATTQLDIFAR